MQQQGPQTTNPASAPPLNLVSTEQIQKYLDENKNLIMAILENQNLGKMAECAQYQAILQKNLMYLAAIADAQPQGSSTPSQLPTTSVAPQGNSPVLQPQASIAQQQPNAPVAKTPFQVNAFRPQDQQNQLLQFQQQQQLQPHFGGGANGGVQVFMQPSIGNSGSLMDFRGNQQGLSEGRSGDGRGNSGLGPAEGRG
ncbi:hypothetical protein CDL12_04365 [Handroanthus impetiginosus]|uniref:SS18 N-terminal domain-containing protein n=1 Tax=Handroanthus impetiginosus TaxID=429701 RepID=A0A2G9HZI5_9LAMI|nr:hypothetical protein CDL12_04365 [Handroanthus impetiginosus]